MSILPKQPDLLFNEFNWSDNFLPNQLLSNPFFFEWAFFSDLRNKENPAGIGNLSPNVLEAVQNARSKLADFIQECLILKYSAIQYKLLKGEFTSIEKEYSDPLKIIEYCFKVSTLYWNIVKQYLIGNSFKNSDHEIYFFKAIKPAFVSECDFLSFAYNALLFKNRGPIVDLKFWDREKQRKEKLKTEHPDFFTNYLNGNTDNDEVWFTRTTQVDYSSHDHIISSWFAINRYEAFIESAILQSN